MATTQPALSTLLSQVLIAYTMEFDNEFEHRLPHTTTRGPQAHSRRGPWLVSMAMWSNFLRHLGDEPVPLRDLHSAAELTNLAGLERWGYVAVGSDPADGRPSPPRRDQWVRLKPGGRRAQAVWRPLAAEIEQRWRARFGVAAIDDLRAALGSIVDRYGLELPHYLPVGGFGRRDQARWSPAITSDRGSRDLAALLSPVLLAFTIDVEHESRLSLALGANVLRVLDESGVRVRDLPVLTGLSKEAVANSLSFLGRIDCAVVMADPAVARIKIARLTPKGRAAQGKHAGVVDQVEQQWRHRFGGEDIDRLRHALADILSDPQLIEGLTPYPDGWRANSPYAPQTRAMLADPTNGLPHYPVVSHRGGFPDGS